jgi:sugar (pentulose or hexulose) kinase
MAGIAVTSTSGSLVLTDGRGVPVRPAIIYDDARAAEVASGLAETREEINSSYSLAKAAWVREKEPEVWARVQHILHPSDWLTGKLTGVFGTTDSSNALKLGYDVVSGRWTAAAHELGLSQDLLPWVVSPGAEVGTVSSEASRETGLPQGLPVLAGATDGMASLIASGAADPGHANTTLGTTIVWKVLSLTKPKLGPGMYCHQHPSGAWAPGAASNSGPGNFQKDTSGATPEEMDRLASHNIPSPILCYLLGARGERFPFLNPQAEPFWEGEPQSPAGLRAAQLQSLAFVERWGYERLEECGVKVGDKVFSTGGAARSPVLSELRANVVRRNVVRCKYPVAAFGAAILAAAKTLYGSDVSAAIRGMTQVCDTFEPDRAASDRFEPIYRSFREACARRGYV